MVQEWLKQLKSITVLLAGRDPINCEINIFCLTT